MKKVKTRLSKIINYELHYNCPHCKGKYCYMISSNKKFKETLECCICGNPYKLEIKEAD